MPELTSIDPVLNLQQSAHADVAAQSCCPVLDQVTEVSGILPLYMQLLTLGTLMIIGHCSGMCGPLILSFRLGSEQEKQQARSAMEQLLSYQFGKGIIYMSAGAAAALLGSSLSGLRDVAAYICIFIAAIILLQVVLWWLPWSLRLLPSAWQTRVEQTIRTLQRRSFQVRKQSPLRGSFLLGMSMSLLPCMLPFWVLGLAASSASWIHGIGLMAVFVVLTTPLLLIFAVAPHLMGAWRRRSPRFVTPVALCCSAVWMLLIGLASLNIIGHLSFELGPTHLVFW